MAHGSPAYDHKVIDKPFLYLNYTQTMKTQCIPMSHCQGHRPLQKMACLPIIVERLMGSISSKPHFVTWTKQNSPWAPV